MLTANKYDFFIFLIEDQKFFLNGMKVKMNIRF